STRGGQVSEIVKLDLVLARGSTARRAWHNVVHLKLPAFYLAVVGRQNLARHKSAMLPACSNSSGFSSRSSWPGYGRARTLYSRTCCCATSSLSSPVRLEYDRVLGFAVGTSCSGSWLAASVPAGVSIYLAIV